uniref:Uncharacterized protein n=1 Tax=Timema poppense TaxID=170557 RepID=A0A7R9H3N4_TIMPO|nr:unnamed protein product [Timema poppensis]
MSSVDSYDDYKFQGPATGGLRRLEKLMADVESNKNSSHLDKTVCTVTLDLPGAVTRGALDLFLQRVLWETASDDSEHRPDDRVSVIRLKVDGTLCLLTSQTRSVSCGVYFELRGVKSGLLYGTVLTTSCARYVQGIADSRSTTLAISCVSTGSGLKIPVCVGLRGVLYVAYPPGAYNANFDVS